MRSFRYWLLISIVVVSHWVVASCSTVGSIRTRQELKGVTGPDAADILTEESVPEPFQPSEELKTKLDTVYVIPPEESVGKQPSVVIINNTPLFPYMYLESERTYAFHPMAMGRFIKEKATKSQIDQIVSLASLTKNNGLTWFYPSLYKNARMQGPFWRYSCISQGTILAGFTKRAIESDGDFSVARKVFLGMTLDYFEGGVNLENRALLEMPSYLGAPEIILNGWLDALIHIQDYAEASGDEEAKEFLSRNMASLAESLEHFDVPDEKISRYSDLCPYRVSLRSESDDVPEYYVEYRPIHDGFRLMRYKLRELSQETLSIYDNQITGRNGSILKATISASALFDTVIISTAPFEISFNTGSTDLTSSTPSGTGRTIKQSSGPTTGGLHEIILDAEREDLIRGFPTNFSKLGGKNYYHSYHVVALMLLAKNCPIPETTRRTILSYALKWKEYMATKALPSEYSFTAFEVVFDGIRNNRATVEAMTHLELERWARLQM